LGDGTKTVYYQIKDKAGLISSTYSDTIMLSTVVPTCSIVVNGGDAYTISTSVMLYLTYTDAFSGVSQVRYSNDGVWDTEDWDAPAITKLWSLTSEDGMKTVYYQVKNNVGLLSLTYSDSITLSTTFPTGSVVINNGDDSTSSVSVTLGLTYLDAISGVSQVRYSNDGVWDTENWETPATIRAWSLTSGDETKTVYYQVKNNAGLTSITYSDTIILKTAPTPTPTPTITPTPTPTPTPSITPTVMPTTTPTPSPSPSQLLSASPSPLSETTTTPLYLYAAAVIVIATITATTALIIKKRR
jgi:hypothetical protein